MNKEIQLYSSIEAGKNDEARALIDELGTDFKADGGTALNYAALYNNFEIARFCIANKADIDAEYDSTKVKGYTPLMAACKNGNIEMAQLLLENGANLEKRDKRGFNALELACANFKMPKIVHAKEIIKLLLDYGANPLEPYFDGLNYLEYVRKNESAELADFLNQNKR